MNPEKQWLKKMKKGDKAAAEALISTYYDEIYVFAYRQLGDKESAMDMVQEIFLSVWQTIGCFDHRKANFRTWLYRVATNKVIDYRRRNRPVLVPFDDLELLQTSDLKIEQEASLREIEEYVSELDATLQRVFRLHLYAGYTFREIADMLNEPESKIKTSYYRLLKTIRKEFSDDEDTYAESK